MSQRTQDTIALLRSLQMISREAYRTYEQYLRQIWRNSSVKEVCDRNCQQTEKCTQDFSVNPSKEIEKIRVTLNETIERTSVVVEGVKQYAISSIQHNMLSQNQLLNQSEQKQNNLNNNAVDVSSITLEELEDILAQRNEKRLKDETSNTNNKPRQRDKKNDENDELYMKTWMKYIAQHDPQQDKLITTSDTKILPYKIVEESILPPPIPVENTVRTTTPELSEQSKKINIPELTSVAKQRTVPSTRIARLISFGNLFAGLSIGTVNELTKGVLGLGGSKNVRDAVFSSSNADRIVDTLCKVRGAALKIGQLLSIQDSSVVSPQLVKAFDRVRQAADYMPDWQVEKVMVAELGSDWRKKFKIFYDKPFAAASIGQVHRGELNDENGTEVAIKIQYPGVAKSIESDIDNLVGMLKVWDVFPPGIFIDNVVKVAKRELAWEVDYIREAEYTDKFGEMISEHPEYRVPKVIRDLTTKSVLTTELVPGLPLDKCFEMSYEDRYFIGETVLKLCLIELFTLRCMQTDPNWSNFLYDKENRKLMLIDFGATRFYSEEFINNYRAVIVAAVQNNQDLVLKLSKEMGFLTGYETKQMEEAHVSAVMILGELFRKDGGFDFGKQNTTQRIASLVPTMIAHRLCPPPEEIYSIHRKLSGVFLLCSRLNIKLNCYPFFESIIMKK